MNREKYSVLVLIVMFVALCVTVTFVDMEKGKSHSPHNRAHTEHDH